MVDTRGNKRVLVGVVVGDKMDKTVVVQVTRVIKHRFYHKYIKRRMKYKVHDERNEYHTGDRVEIIESRPRSKTKRWRVRKLLERPQVV